MHNTDCLFCEIINGNIPTDKLYENEQLIIINDINPKAPHHLLIIPKKHIPTTNAIEEHDFNLIGDIMYQGANIAKQLDISDDGYRLIFNCNIHGGQEIYHIHCHLLGGAQLPNFEKVTKI